MAFGLEISNSSGSVQIDENYSNLRLYGKYTTNTYVDTFFASYDSDVTSYSFEIDPWPSTLLSCVVAVSCNGKYLVANPGIVYDNGSNYVLAIQGLVEAAAGTTVTIYVFTFIDTPATGYGFYVYNSSGKITFDASYKYLRLASVYRGSNYNSALPSATLASGKTYAQANGLLSARSVVTGSGTGAWSSDSYAFFTRMTSNVLASKERHTELYSAKVTDPMPPDMNNLAFMLFIVDVTGY